MEIIRGVVEDLEGEIWRNVKDYEGLYMVSSLGRVKSLIGINERLLKQLLNNCGYLRVTLSKKGQKAKRYFVHRLLAIAFLPNPEGKKTVNHLNADKQLNTVENLSWATHAEQMAHAIEFGLFKDHSKAVLCTNKQTGEQLHFNSQNEASDALGIHFNSISKAIKERKPVKGWSFKRQGDCNE